MESRVYGANSIVIWLHRHSFLPDGIQCWVSLTVLLAGILSNVYLGLYIREKYSKSLSGIRILICNQIFANLLALFSHAFLPTRNAHLDGTRLNNVCKVIPSLGFFGVTVSISNLACICVPYYYNKKNAAVLSRGSAWLVVASLWFIALLLTTPLAVSLESIEITVNNTSANMCTVIWQNEQYRNLFINNVFFFKFVIPLLVIFNICMKIELLYIHSSKIFPSFPNIPAILVDIIVATCLLLLVYFYPLHNAYAKETSPSSYFFASATALAVVRVLELVGLANCSMVPVVLISCIDEYGKVHEERDFQKKKEDYLEVIIKDDTGCLLSLPTANVGYVTYDVLTEDVVPSKSMLKSPKQVEILISM